MVLTLISEQASKELEELIENNIETIKFKKSSINDLLSKADNNYEKDIIKRQLFNFEYRLFKEIFDKIIETYELEEYEFLLNDLLEPKSYRVDTLSYDMIIKEVTEAIKRWKMN